jgi:phosphate uptake regulator
MERRKIVRSGNTSFILALPIAWIRKNNLDSGKLVQVLENEQGDLIISSEKTKATKAKEYVTIKVDGKSEQSIYLEFLGAYIRDASSIIFEGKEVSRRTSKLLDTIRLFIGLDVIEQSTKSIVVKNFFSLDEETSPRLLLKKMDIVNRASFEVLQQFFDKSFANEDFYELQKLDEQNERLAILARKSILKLIEHPRLMKTIQTNQLQIMKERMSVQSLREISKHLLSLGKSFLVLSPKKKEVKKMQVIFSETRTNYSDIVTAVHNKTIEEVVEYLGKSPTSKVNELLKAIDDRIGIQTLNSFFAIYTQLDIIAHETLA